MSSISSPLSTQLTSHWSLSCSKLEQTPQDHRDVSVTKSRGYSIPRYCYLDIWQFGLFALLWPTFPSWHVWRKHHLSVPSAVAALSVPHCQLIPFCLTSPVRLHLTENKNYVGQIRQNSVSIRNQGDPKAMCLGIHLGPYFSFPASLGSPHGRQPSFVRHELSKQRKEGENVVTPDSLKRSQSQQLRGRNRTASSRSAWATSHEAGREVLADS